MDETQKELQALPPITISPHATSSSLQLLDQTPNPPLRSLKQATTTGKVVHMLDHVSSLFQNGDQRNRILQVRMVGSRSKVKKKIFKLKDGEKYLNYWSCSLVDVQAALRGTKQILSDEEVRQLTESGCDIYIYIYPMQWIEVDKKERTSTKEQRLLDSTSEVQESFGRLWEVADHRGSTH